MRIVDEDEISGLCSHDNSIGEILVISELPGRSLYFQLARGEKGDSP